MSTVKQSRGPPISHPYSFEGHILWRRHPNDKSQHTVWSDRLHQWDSAKYRALVNKYAKGAGDYFWDSAKQETVVEFMREYLDKQDLEVCFLMKYCNQGSGFPVWRIDYFLESEVRPVGVQNG